jgi:hypothetical protein
LRIAGRPAIASPHGAARYACVAYRGRKKKVNMIGDSGRLL